MKYVSTNIFSDFEFHDAKFEFESFENGTMTVSVKHLNIHKTAKQNSFESDMELECAEISFESFQVESFTLGKALRVNEDCELCFDDSETIYEDSVAEGKFIDELRHGITVLDFATLENGNAFIDGIGKAPWFSTQFLFDCATVRWDEFLKPAWYTTK